MAISFLFADSSIMRGLWHLGLVMSYGITVRSNKSTHQTRKLVLIRGRHCDCVSCRHRFLKERVSVKTIIVASNTLLLQSVSWVVVDRPHAFLLFNLYKLSQIRLFWSLIQRVVNPSGLTYLTSIWGITEGGWIVFPFVCYAVDNALFLLPVHVRPYGQF